MQQAGNSPGNCPGVKRLIAGVPSINRKTNTTYAAQEPGKTESTSKSEAAGQHPGLGEQAARSRGALSPAQSLTPAFQSHYSLGMETLHEIKLSRLAWKRLKQITAVHDALLFCAQAGE